MNLQQTKESNSPGVSTTLAPKLPEASDRQPSLPHLDQALIYALERMQADGRPIHQHPAGFFVLHDGGFLCNVIQMKTLYGCRLVKRSRSGLYSLGEKGKAYLQATNGVDRANKGEAGKGA